LRRVCVLATAAVGALALTGAASAKAPILQAVGHVDRHPTATWTLPAGVKSAVVEVASSPSTSSDGYFFNENVVAFDVPNETDTSWTHNFQLDPGTYFVHVGGIDEPCFFAGQCPVREFSQTMTLVIGGSPTSPPPPPPPPPSALLSVSRSGLGSGTIASDPAGINCGTDCSESYAAGIHVMLTATPAPGSAFGGWSNSCGLSPRCEVTLSGSAFVLATFNLAPAAPPPPPPPTPPPPATATPAAVDTVAPRVKALPAAGRAGSVVSLRFLISDNRKSTRQQILVYRGSVLLALVRRPFSRSLVGKVKKIAWRSPAKPATLRFCVVAWDRADNASPRRCARLILF
jgi:hypothetical protein